jgi:signal transduction histidine kinase
MARELHDDVVQRLSVLSMRLHMLANPNPVPVTDSSQELEAAREEVMRLAQDVQAISRRLHPPRLEYLGIAPAAEALCHELSSPSGNEIGFHADAIPDGLSRRIAVCLYRVLQEALQNVIKHADAGKVDVSLRAGVEQIELTVRDSGIGFDVEETKGPGLGLISMKERLKAVRGRLDIRSQPRHGTTIHASVPMVQDESETPMRPEGSSC